MPQLQFLVHYVLVVIQQQKLIVEAKLAGPQISWSVGVNMQITGTWQRGSLWWCHGSPRFLLQFFFDRTGSKKVFKRTLALMAFTSSENRWHREACSSIFEYRSLPSFVPMPCRWNMVVSLATTWQASESVRMQSCERRSSMNATTCYGFSMALWITTISQQLKCALVKSMSPIPSSCLY